MKESVLASLMRERAHEGFVGQHPVFKKLISDLKKLADKNISVLLLGETGTGKSRCAEFLHHYSDRSNGPFILDNCGAGPVSLFESQLFGHIKGAFTGAHCDKAGLVEEAHSGTLVLDEINSLSLESQVKLNHFLENGYFRRVGENKIRQADTRIITISNVDLRKEIAAGAFREDLFYRLAEYEISVPPLRQRPTDIPLLVNYFFKKYKHLSSVENISFTRSAIVQLQDYTWPGNIRELENTIKKCLIDVSQNCIEHVPLPRSSHSAKSVFTSLQELPWKIAKGNIIAEFERNYCRWLLEKYKGVVSRCARHAQMHSSDFWKLLRKYDMDAHAFKDR
jgi:DNA-binding NtrC family response regulator